jgi:predicted transcriptional regulator of viral defense system
MYFIIKISAGISRRTLYLLRDEGIIEQVSRGVYRLSDLPSLSQPDKAAVALRAPHAVICLTSALSFHEITTQIPSAVDIAILTGTTIPRISYPPVRIYRQRGQPVAELVEATILKWNGYTIAFL